MEYRIADIGEYEKLFRENYSLLCSYANGFLKDTDTAEEIVQDLFCNIWADRDRIVFGTSVKAYLYRAVRNRCLNSIKHLKIRSNYRAEQLMDSGGEKGELDLSIEASELEMKIRTAIDQLPPERKKIFLLSRYEGLKYKEIADRLGISVKTVENQMGSAIRFLKEKLSEFLIIAGICIAEIINLFFR